MSARPFVGGRRRRLTIETPNDAPDEVGGVKRTWTASGYVWAEIRPVRQADRFEAVRPEQVVTHVVTFRRREGLTAASRFARGERTFRVLAIEDGDPAGRYQRALCEEVGP